MALFCLCILGITQNHKAQQDGNSQGNKWPIFGGKNELELCGTIGYVSLLACTIDPPWVFSQQIMCLCCTSPFIQLQYILTSTLSIYPGQRTILWRRSQAEQIFQRNLKEDWRSSRWSHPTFPLLIFHTMKSLGNCLGKLMLPPGKFQVPKQLFLTSPPEVLLRLAAFHRSYFLLLT